MVLVDPSSESNAIRVKYHGEIDFDLEFHEKQKDFPCQDLSSYTRHTYECFVVRVRAFHFREEFFLKKNVLLSLTPTFFPL